MSSGLSPALNPVGVIARYVLLGAALGLPAGILWVLLAPRVQVESAADGGFVQAYPKGFAQADLTLAALLMAVGVMIGVIACRRLRTTGFARGWGQVIGVMAGALSAGLVARVLGWWLAGRDASANPAGTFDLPVSLRSPGVLLMGVFTALLVVLLYSAFAGEPVRPAAEPSGHSSPPPDSPV